MHATSNLAQGDLDAEVRALCEPVELNADEEWSQPFDHNLRECLRDHMRADWTLAQPAHVVEKAYATSGTWTAAYGATHLRLVVLSAWAMMRRFTEQRAPDLRALATWIVEQEGDDDWASDPDLINDTVDALCDDMRDRLAEIRKHLQMDLPPPGWEEGDDGEWLAKSDAEGRQALAVEHIIAWNATAAERLLQIAREGDVASMARVMRSLSTSAAHDVAKLNLGEPRMSGGLLAAWVPTSVFPPRWLIPFAVALGKAIFFETLLSCVMQLRRQPAQVNAQVIDAIGRSCWDAGLEFRRRSREPLIEDRHGNSVAVFAQGGHKPSLLDVKALRSLTCHRLIRYLLARAWRREELGIKDALVLDFVGGLSAVSKALGLTRNSATSELRAVLHAGASIRIVWPDGSTGPLWDLDEGKPPARGRPAVWRITVRIPLDVDGAERAAQQIGVGVPFQLGDKVSDHAAEAFLQLLLAMPHRLDSRQLAERTGLPEPRVVQITRAVDSGKPILI